MVSALFIFSYLPHNTLFFQTPYYRALSGIIGTKFAVLLLYYGSKWVKFSCPKCPQTRINTGFICPKTSSSGIPKRIDDYSPLSGIIPYLPHFRKVLSSIIPYHADKICSKLVVNPLFCCNSHIQFQDSLLKYIQIV